MTRSIHYAVDAVVPGEEDELSCKEVRETMLAMLRDTMDPSLTAPNPEFDASAEVFAAMDYNVRRITWEMVKDELAADQEFRDLADWIQGGCSGPGESLSTHIKPFWRTKSSLHCEDGVPMLGTRGSLP